QGQAQIAARHGIEPSRFVNEPLDLGPRAALASRVDDDLLPATRTAQVALPGSLDPRGADAVAFRVALAATAGERFGVDLRHVAEQVRAELAVGVVANRHGHDVHAAERFGVRLERGDDVARDVLLDEDLLELARRPIGARVAQDVAQPLLDALAFLGAELEVLGELRPGLVHVETARNDVDVVRRAVRGEDAALRVADDAARGREADLEDDVVAGF